MGVVFVDAAVLRDLGTAGEDDAGVYLEDDVWRALIFQRAVPLFAQRVAGENFLDAERILVGGRAQVGYDARGERRVGQPDQRSVVGDVEGFSSADSGRRLSAADAATLLY